MSAYAPNDIDKTMKSIKYLFLPIILRFKTLIIIFHCKAANDKSPTNI